MEIFLFFDDRMLLDFVSCHVTFACKNLITLVARKLASFMYISDVFLQASLVKHFAAVFTLNILPLVFLHFVLVIAVTRSMVLYDIIMMAVIHIAGWIPKPDIYSDIGSGLIY